MQFASPVWAVPYLGGHIFDESAHMKSLLVMYR